jgi:hypothetical protein
LDDRVRAIRRDSPELDGQSETGTARSCRRKFVIAPYVQSTADMLGIFIAFPWLALLPALAFIAIGYWSHRTAAWVAAVAWLLYSAYETAMKRRSLCSGECNIRVDLLLLYPILLVLSIAAVVSAVRARRDAL